MDNLHAPGTSTRHLLHALPKAYPGYQVARVPWGTLLCTCPTGPAAIPARYSLGHVRRMEDDRIPKDATFTVSWHQAARRVGRSALRFKDTCKRGMKACKINTDTWEDAAGDRAHWRQKVKQEVEHADSERGLKAADKRARRKLSATSTTNTPTGFICSASSRDCRSRIGLYSHTRRCSSTKSCGINLF